MPFQLFGNTINSIVMSKNGYLSADDGETESDYQVNKHLIGLFNPISYRFPVYHTHI
jgi:hypothetical protein